MVQNLTIKEFLEQQVAADKNKVIISCFNHKTGPQGRAQLVLTKPTEQILLSYKQLVQEHLEPATGCNDLFF